MSVHLLHRDHGHMGPAPAVDTIRHKGHLSITLLAAFPALQPRREHTETVLTGVLHSAALYGVLSGTEALSLDLIDVRRHQQPEQ